MDGSGQFLSNGMQQYQLQATDDTSCDQQPPSTSFLTGHEVYDQLTGLSHIYLTFVYNTRTVIYLC